MTLLGLELHGIINWHDCISFCQQGQADQQPNFQGYPSTTLIFHGNNNINNISWEIIKKSTRNDYKRCTTLMSLYGYHITKLPGIVILTSENILPRSASSPPYIGSLNPKSKRKKNKRKEGGGQESAIFIHSATNVNSPHLN